MLFSFSIPGIELKSSSLTKLFFIKPLKTSSEFIARIKMSTM